MLIKGIVAHKEQVPADEFLATVVIRAIQGWLCRVVILVILVTGTCHIAVIETLSIFDISLYSSEAMNSPTSPKASNRPIPPGFLPSKPHDRPLEELSKRELNDRYLRNKNILNGPYVSLIVFK